MGNFCTNKSNKTNKYIQLITQNGLNLSETKLPTIIELEIIYKDKNPSLSRLINVQLFAYITSDKNLFLQISPDFNIDILFKYLSRKKYNLFDSTYASQFKKDLLLNKNEFRLYQRVNHNISILLSLDVLKDLNIYIADLYREYLEEKKTKSKEKKMPKRTLNIIENAAKPITKSHIKKIIEKGDCNINCSENTLKSTTPIQVDIGSIKFDEKDIIMNCKNNKNKNNSDTSQSNSNGISFNSGKKQKQKHLFSPIKPFPTLSENQSESDLKKEEKRSKMAKFRKDESGAQSAGIRRINLEDAEDNLEDDSVYTVKDNEHKASSTFVLSPLTHASSEKNKKCSKVCGIMSKLKPKKQKFDTSFITPQKYELPPWSTEQEIITFKNNFNKYPWMSTNSKTKTAENKIISIYFFLYFAKKKLKWPLGVTRGVYYYCDNTVIIKDAVKLVYDEHNLQEYYENSDDVDKLVVWCLYCLSAFGEIKPLIFTTSSQYEFNFMKPLFSRQYVINSRTLTLTWPFKPYNSVIQIHKDDSVIKEIDVKNIKNEFKSKTKMRIKKKAKENARWMIPMGKELINKFGKVGKK